MDEPKVWGIRAGWIGVAHVALLIPVIGWFGELQGRGSPWAYPMALTFWLCWAFVMAYLVRRDRSQADARRLQPTE